VLAAVLVGSAEPIKPQVYSASVGGVCRVGQLTAGGSIVKSAATVGLHSRKRGRTAGNLRQKSQRNDRPELQTHLSMLMIPNVTVK